MSTLAPHPPWSGIDNNTPGVAQCTHRWVTHRVGDVVANCYNPNELMTWCARCYAPRCEAQWTRSAGIMAPAGPRWRCTLPRHHRIDHSFDVNGMRVLRPVGA